MDIEKRPTSYWATAPSYQVAAEIDARVDQFYRWVRSSGSYSRWRRMYRAYYAGFVEFASIGAAGEAGEQIRASVNHLRNLVKHMIVAVTGQELTFEPRATNSDHKSQTQTILSRGILEYVVKAKHLGQLRRRAVELALLFGDGYILKTWDSGAGKDYLVNPDSGSIEKTGDIQYRAFPPTDVAVDVSKDDAVSHRWHTVRTFENRYDLAAKWPELADKILAAPSKLEEVNRLRLAEFTRYESQIFNVESDEVAVYNFFHAHCDSLPDGRMVQYLTPDCVLFDGPMPYRQSPVYRLAPDDMIGTAFGYTEAFDALPLQQIVNALHATIASNQQAFGVQNIWAKKGSGLNVSHLAGGMNLIESTEPPQALQLTSTAPEIFNYLQTAVENMEVLLGINAVQRGQLPAEQKMSGSALALLKSQTLEYLAGLQQADQEFMASIATGTIQDYRDFAKAPQVAMLAGKNNRSYMREFTGDDLDRIERVEVDLGNPLQSSTSGRMTIAQDLMQIGGVTPQQYLQIIRTGTLDVATEGTSAELLNIKSENESMGEGRAVVAVITDNHPLHLKEHATVLASPESREDPALVQNVTLHLQEHLETWKGMDPALCAAMGIPPAPVPMMAPPAPGGLPQPPGPNTPGGEAQNQAPEMMAPPGVDDRTMPGMPQMPVDPSTGQRAPAPGNPLPV